MFSSVILVRPPAQPWFRLRAKKTPYKKTWDLLPLSGGGGSKGRVGGVWTRLERHHSNLKVSVLSALLLYWPTKLLVAAVSLIWWCYLCYYCFQLLLCLKRVASRLFAPHPSNLSILLAELVLFKIEPLLYLFCTADFLLTLWVKLKMYMLNGKSKVRSLYATGGFSLKTFRSLSRGLHQF